MKFLVVLAVLVASSLAQRGTYSGSRVHGISDVAYRFRNPNTNTGNTGNSNGIPNVNTNDNTVTGDTNNNVGNRLGEDGAGQRRPVDNNGFIDYSKVFENWPRENLPFSYVNEEALKRHRGMMNNRPNSVPTNVNSNMGNGVQAQPSNGGQPTFQGRFGGNENPSNSFTVVRNGESKTYEYDPQTDSWHQIRF